MRAPTIENSSKEERLEYIQKTFRCIADCDMCGICQVYHGKQPEIVFDDYIEGVREFFEIAAEYR